MEEASSSTKCRCDPLKQILHWLFHKLNISEPEGITSKLHYLYKSSVLRSTIFECGLSQETLLLMEDLLRIPIRDRVKALLERLSIDGQLMPYLTGLSLDHHLGHVHLSLNLTEMKGAILRHLLSQSQDSPSSYQCHGSSYQVQIVMNCRSGSEDNWPEYRKLVVGQALSKILKLTGHQIDDRHHTSLTRDPDQSDYDYDNLLIIAKNLKNVKEPKNAKILSDPDIVLKSRLGETTADSRSIYALLNERLDRISESKRASSSSLPSGLSSAQNLAKATLHYDLLRKPLDAGIELAGCQLETKREGHHALFIMYNYARLLSILKRFNEQVDQSEYPPLPHLDQVDFSGLCEKEEETHLLRLLTEWPRILDTCVNFLCFELNLFLIPRFLLELSRSFNSFYFEVAVLVPCNAPHNFPTMMARLYLVKGLCLVFQQCLDILQFS